MKDAFELFVPGRLCLFGEHSDWAGGHRRQNSIIEPGCAIVVPTNQGTCARVSRLEHPVLRFIARPFGETLEAELEEAELLEIARRGGLFSYVAGVAHEVVSNYENHPSAGLEIDNYRTDLPVKKGLSSSASVCVLTARAFNECWNLKWKPKRVMEVAYLGEIATPSRCGRMDQACAFGAPVMMTFDADRVEVERIAVAGEFFFLIVDLRGTKDTRKILSALNEGFPFPRTASEREKHECLGALNKRTVERARAAIAGGDAKQIGVLMTEAQKNFDRYLASSCPAELTAPKLHAVLENPRIKELIWGGKGVGSQGDGTAQLICRSRADREKAKEILRKELGMDGHDLDLKKE